MEVVWKSSILQPEILCIICTMKTKTVSAIIMLARSSKIKTATFGSARCRDSIILMLKPVNSQCTVWPRECPTMPYSELYPMNRDSLWISTNKGLSQFDPATRIFHNYTLNDGLQSDEFKLNAACKSSNGALCISAGNNGFNEFIPSALYVEKYEPPLVYEPAAYHQ